MTYEEIDSRVEFYQTALNKLVENLDDHLVLHSAVEGFLQGVNGGGVLPKDCKVVLDSSHYFRFVYNHKTSDVLWSKGGFHNGNENLHRYISEFGEGWGDCYEEEKASDFRETRLWGLRALEDAKVELDFEFADFLFENGVSGFAELLSELCP